MNKLLKGFLLGIVATFLVAGSAASTLYSWQPNPVDLYDLDHYKYYTWGIDVDGPFTSRENIVNVSLSFTNIRNWDDKENDLWVHLLNDVPEGVTVGRDDQAEGDWFVGQGIRLVDYHDLDTNPQNLTHFFDSSQIDTLIAYWADGKFGFGFDPDCHYWNDGITLTIETVAPVPEPATMLLLGMGLLGLAGITRKKIKA